ncbi:MAG: DUF2214 family protein, partial [Planctomycetota bacterium]
TELVRYLHFLGIIGIAGALVSQHLLIKKEMTPAEVKRASVVNAIYGVSALLALGAGVALWVAVGKPKEFYTKNGLFHAKFGLYLLLGGLSIVPTLFLRRSRAAGANVTPPKSVAMALRFQLLILLVMPLLASLMAAGVGLKSADDLEGTGAAETEVTPEEGADSDSE